MKSISPKAHFHQYYGKCWRSLVESSHLPHSHPRQQTAEEYAMIERYYRRTKDKMILWDMLRENGYARCYNSLLRAIKRLKLEETPEKRKGYKSKPYKRADYPG